jgi:hypothetical protein
MAEIKGSDLSKRTGFRRDTPDIVQERQVPVFDGSEFKTQVPDKPVFGGFEQLGDSSDPFFDYDFSVKGQSPLLEQAYKIPYVEDLDMNLPFGIGSLVDRGINYAVDAPLGGFSGLGVMSTILNPTIEDAPWANDPNLRFSDRATTYNTGGGGLIGTAGNIAFGQLSDDYKDYQAGEEGFEFGITPQGEAYSIKPAMGGYLPGEVYSGPNKMRGLDFEGRDISTPSEARAYQNEMLGYIDSGLARSAGISRTQQELANAYEAIEKQTNERVGLEQGFIDAPTSLELEQGFVDPLTGEVPTPEELAMMADELDSYEAERDLGEYTSLSGNTYAGEYAANKREADQQAQAQTGNPFSSAVTDQNGNPVGDGQGGVVTSNQAAADAAQQAQQQNNADNPNAGDGGGGGGGK